MTRGGPFRAVEAIVSAHKRDLQSGTQLIQRQSIDVTRWLNAAQVLSAQTAFDQIAQQVTSVSLA